MDLKYSIDELKELYDNAVFQTNKYKKLIEKLDLTVNELELFWSTRENGVYDEFKNRYNEKKQMLINASDDMLSFCSKLNEKIMEFDDAENNIKNSFS